MSRSSFYLQNISPFVRYAHMLTLSSDNGFRHIRSCDYRLFYIVSGNGMICAGDQQYPAEKGCLYLWQPGVAYSLLPNAEGITLIGINFDFTDHFRHLCTPIPPKPCPDFEEKDIVELLDFADCPALNEVVYLPHAAVFEDTFHKIYQEFTVKQKYYGGKIKGYLLTLLYELVGLLEAPDRVHGVPALVDDLLAYIREHYADPLTNTFLGEQFSFHPTYINRVLRAYTGLSLHQYVIRYRLYAALEQLQSTRLSVAEIADRNGFSDPNYFSRCFKQHFGYSPQAFRKNHR